MKTIAVYGSLRHNKYNHDMLQGARLVGISKMKGMMYLISTYPAFVASDEKEARKHTFEVYEVQDEVYERIRGMELGAGYKEMTAKFDIKDTQVEAVYYEADDELLDYCKKSRPLIEGY